MLIRVFGSLGDACNVMITLIAEVAATHGKPVQLQRIEGRFEALGCGVTMTLGVVIDGKLVHAGGTPGRGQIERRFAAYASQAP